MRFSEILFEYHRNEIKKNLGSAIQPRLEAEKVDIDELLEKLEKADPSPSLGYVRWLVRTFIQGVKLEDLTSRVADILEKYHKLKKSRKLKPEHADIMRIKSYRDLEDVLKQYADPEPKVIADRGKYTKHVDNSNCLIVELLDETAAKFWGQSTTWCTAAKNDNRFDYYHKDGPLFVIIPKKPKYVGEKYQLWFEKYAEFQLMDDNNDAVAENTILSWTSRFPEIKSATKKYEEKPIFLFDNPDEEKQRQAIRSSNGYHFQFIKNPSYEIQKAAIQENGYTIRFIENPSYELQKLAIFQNGAAIKHIKNPTEAVKRAAVRNDWTVLQYIEDPSEELKKLAVQLNGYSISQITNPSEEIQMLAVQQNPSVLIYIKNPTPKVREYVNSHKLNSP